MMFSQVLLLLLGILGVCMGAHQVKFFYLIFPELKKLITEVRLQSNSVSLKKGDHPTGDELSLLISEFNANFLSNQDIWKRRIKTDEDWIYLKENLPLNTDVLPPGTTWYYINGLIFVYHKKNLDKAADKPELDVQVTAPSENFESLMFQNGDVLNNILALALKDWPVLQLVCKHLYFKCHPTALEKDREALAIAYPKTRAYIFPMPDSPLKC